MDVTSARPGPWIKNYGMNLLTIFYLQQLEKPIMPPLYMVDELKREAIEENGIKFIKDVGQINFKTENTDSVAELVIGFFKFYAGFDFKQHAVYIERGTYVIKVDRSPIDIIDLFGTENVASNVGKKYFVTLRRALSITNELDFDLKNETKSKEAWGLVKLFQNCEEKMFQFRKPKRLIKPGVSAPAPRL